MRPRGFRRMSVPAQSARSTIHREAAAGDVEQDVAPVVPLEEFQVRQQRAQQDAALADPRLRKQRWRADRRRHQFHRQRALTAALVSVPRIARHIKRPRAVHVAAENGDVPYALGRQKFEHAVARCLISVPRVGQQRTSPRLSDARKHDLLAQHAPPGPGPLRRAQLVEQPDFLPRTENRPRRVVQPCQGRSSRPAGRAGHACRA